MGLHSLSRETREAALDEDVRVSDHTETSLESRCRVERNYVKVILSTPLKIHSEQPS